MWCTWNCNGDWTRTRTFSFKRLYAHPDHFRPFFTVHLRSFSPTAENQRNHSSTFTNLSQHAHVTKHNWTDRQSAVSAQVLKELMNESGIKLNDATLAQTMGMVERIQQQRKKILKNNDNRYINLAIMAHNTTYHQSPKSARIESFHWGISYNTLDLKFGSPFQINRTKVQLKTLINEVNQKCKETNAKNFEAFHKYRNYYNRKTSAQPLKIGDYVFLLNPKCHIQSDETQFGTLLGNGPYKVTKHFNYIVHKTGTLFDQWVHRTRLRIFIPHENVHHI